jgi:hypothetical protein
MRRSAIAVMCVAIMLGGCAALTPEQKAKVDAATAALNDAVAQATAVKATFDAYVVEYKAIKAQVDAGASLPAALVARYAQLSDLIKQGAATVQTAVEKVQVAKKALEDAQGSGVPWYSWALPILSALLGLGAGYFPGAAPAIAAAQAIIKGVATVTAADPKAGQAVKDAVLDSSRALGVEAKVDAMVQKYDPPKV